MTRKGKAYYINSTGSNLHAVSRGMDWLVSEARRRAQEGLVVVPGKQTLKHLSGANYDAAFEQLNRNNQCQLRGVTLRLMTERLKAYRCDGPILVIYGDQGLLDQVDALSGAADVLHIPWIQEDGVGWRQTWNAQDFDAPDLSTAEEPERDQPDILNMALHSLTRTVNLSTGIGHASDRLRAIETFETLFHKGVSVDPETVRQCLVRGGWNPEDARKVSDLAARIFQGRRPKGSTGGANERLWNLWHGELGG